MTFFLIAQHWKLREDTAEEVKSFKEEFWKQFPNVNHSTKIGIKWNMVLV